MSIDALAEQLPTLVAARVRRARADRGWTLDHLADVSGVSRRMIVNVESAASNASIATLLRLATALGVSLADLVAPTPGPSTAGAMTVTRAAARQPLWRSDAGGSAVLVASANVPDMFELWDWTLGPGDRYESAAHTLGSHELIHVHSGRLHLITGGLTRDLNPGDAASFAADVPHAYANTGRRLVHFTMTVLEPLSPR